MGVGVTGEGVKVVGGVWSSFNRCYCYLRHDRQMKSIFLRFNCSFNLSVELWEINFKTLMYTC